MENQKNYRNVRNTHEQMEHPNNYNISKKPINNYDPSLSRKARTPNLYNRQSNTNGPVKLTNNKMFKKPGTPDSTALTKSKNLNQQNFGGLGNYGNIRKNNTGVNFSRFQPLNKNKVMGGSLKRPSTAPHKDKLNKNGTFKGMGNTTNNFRPNYKGMSGPTKRVPSPMLHTQNNFGKNQGFRPEKYRIPSPMIKPSSSSDIFKKSKFGYN